MARDTAEETILLDFTSNGSSRHLPSNELCMEGVHDRYIVHPFAL
jgi:hypothetical protein